MSIRKQLNVSSENICNVAKYYDSNQDRIFTRILGYFLRKQEGHVAVQCSINRKVSDIAVTKPERKQVTNTPSKSKSTSHQPATLIVTKLHIYTRVWTQMTTLSLQQLQSQLTQLTQIAKQTHKERKRSEIRSIIFSFNQ